MAQSDDLIDFRDTSSPVPRPTTAQRAQAIHDGDDEGDTFNTTSISPKTTRHVAMVDRREDGEGTAQPAPAQSPPPPQQQQQQQQQQQRPQQPDTSTVGIDESSLEAAPLDPSKYPDDSLTEEDVREHLRDVESSFMPALSPVATGATRDDGGGVDDTYIFDQPNKAAMQVRPQPIPEADEADSTTVSNTTSTFENFDSSPTAAAAARTISRAVSMASSTQQRGGGSSGSGKTQVPDPVEEKGEEAGNTQEATQVSSTGDAESNGTFHSQSQPQTQPQTQTQPERTDAANPPGNSLRLGTRPKYLRSRNTAQRSSTSSFGTDADPHDDSEPTMAQGADFTLQSGSAISVQGMPAPRSSAALARSLSLGSVASGFDDYTDHSLGLLEPLPEIESPGPEQEQNTDYDMARTPRPSKEGFTTAPTDTVIARHVRNVQVPESLAKEYKFKSGLETPRRPSTFTMNSSTTATSKTGKTLTLKEQSSTIERLSKENFDLKLKVMFLSDRLDKLSEEGIKEMISENVDLKTSLAVLQRDNKVLRKRVKELERQAKDEEDRPSTARSTVSSTDQTAKMYDETAQEREEELIFLRERVEEYATEIERLRSDSYDRDEEKRRMTEIVRTLHERSGDSLGRQEEADVWKDLLEQETARREQADDDNRRLRDEVFRLKQEITGGALSHTTNIYNITRRNRDLHPMHARPGSEMSADMEASSHTNLSAGSTLVDELRKESEQLRHENAELRREVSAQTSMLTSRNREKERLYQEIEDLKMAQRHGRAPASTIDSLLERSASRAGGHERSHSRDTMRTRQTSADDEAEREELENKLAEMRDRNSEIKLQNQELQRELEMCMEDFEAAVNGKREAEDRSEQLQEEIDNAMNDLVALQSERDEALREQAEMEHEFESLRAEAQEEIDALEAEADQRNEDMQQLQADLDDRSENFEALQEEMQKMSESLLRLEDEQDNKLRQIGQLESELDSSNKELEELERKIMEANDKNQRLAVQQESAQGEISFLREEQEADKIRIGDLEAALANVEQNLREEKDRSKELDGRLHQEREQREIVANQEKDEIQQFVDELNKECTQAKDEARRLRKSLHSREIEAAEWKERLTELENNLREALGDLNGTRSSLLKSIAKMQRELENTVRELDASKASLNEKDRIIKKRDELLESHALESRKMSELLEKERLSHRNTKSQFDSFQRNHDHLSTKASTQDMRIAELESTRGQEHRRLVILEQQSREQLTERNKLLLVLWQKLSSLCGREWLNGNALVDSRVVPTVDVIATRLPGFSKNLMAAIKTIESMMGSYSTKIKAVERDLGREYQTLENMLEVRTKKLDRLETMVRNSAASHSTTSHELHSRLLRLEDKNRQLKVENATLKTANDVRSRAAAAYSATGNNPEALIPGDPGSPSPSVSKGPGDRSRSRPGSRTTTLTRTHTAPSGHEVALSGGDHTGGSSSAGDNDRRWLFRLRDMEERLKMEREGRNQDRQVARQRLGGLESENKELRDQVRRGRDA